MREDIAEYLFHQGTNFKSYEYLGAHLTPDGKGVIFRVWAPSAKGVFLTGDFSGWQRLPMRRINDGGIHELYVENAKERDKYKFVVSSDKGDVEKSDPFAFYSEQAPASASIIYDLSSYDWKDGDYLSSKGKISHHNLPMNIYEVNLGSFMRKDNGDYYTYKEYSHILVNYCLKNGYNYVEFMPLTEFPFDGSWGYQVTGYFSATSRFGEPKDFMALIDAFHAVGIGVLLDWVPAHFPKDLFGLYEFDGGPLYEAHGWDRIEHKTWGTRKFDFGRTEIQSFLVSSACFFLEKFHIDGIRVDAVASMIYLDYDKKPGEWIPNIYGENKNLEAIAFLQKLNATVHRYFPNAIMIAEESTAFANITKSVADGGLGFDYKWNMGWMNDILSYVSTDPYFRKYEHGKLTFSMVYAFSEKFILPFSHDEVVHGKKSLLDKQFGSYEQKFAGNRALIGFMFAHPGKKLNFMGTEFGQFKEWNYKEGLEFFMKDYPLHKKLSVFYRDINKFYLSTPALYGDDDGWDGFSWLDADNSDYNSVAFERKYKGESVVAVVNFSGVDFGYRIGADEGKYEVVFNSDLKKYGGYGKVGKKIYKTEKREWGGRENSLYIEMPSLSFVYLKKIKGVK